MNNSRGFSLIELLVVVTIVAILSAIALPAYNRYLIKAHVIEMLTIADTYKIKLFENTFSALHKNSVYNLETEIIQQIKIQTLHKESTKYLIEVVAKMRNAQQPGIGIAQVKGVGPLTIQLQGIDVGEVISWTCHVAAPYHDYVPNNCKNNNLE